MDNAPLRQFEHAATAEARLNFAVRDQGIGHPVWGNMLGPIHERFANVADYLARIAGSVPASHPGYSHEKAHELTRQAYRLESDLRTAFICCAGDVPIDEVDDDGGTETVLHSCGLHPEHYGDCGVTDRRDSLRASAESALTQSHDLAGMVWTLLQRPDPRLDDVHELIAEIRSSLNRVEILLPAALDSDVLA